MLLGRDIKDFYRAFILNPYSWWKTYTFALGSFWFNPYLPFGGSSCTSIAQRQSDAVISVARVYGVNANIIVMLDDFLLVVPRRRSETDSAILQRGQDEGRKFDQLLAQLNLPKAPAKDQDAAFSTVWCGVEFFSKTRLVGIPKTKWEALRHWMDTNIKLAHDKRAPCIAAGTLQTALGKLCHAMLIWPAGRPCLYFLWRLFYTAAFRDRTRSKLQIASQPLKLTDDCITALTIWKERLLRAAPQRRIIPCNRKVPCTWVMLLRYRVTLHPLEFRVFIATPSVCWSVAEPKKQGKDKSRGLHLYWMSLLLEVLQVLDTLETATELILVRTNIRWLVTTLEADCYIRSAKGAWLATTLHDTLKSISGTSVEPIPMELKAVYLALKEEMLDCISSLLN